MTRIGKQQERRNRSPRRPKMPGVKTGPKKNNNPQGFKERINAIADSYAQQAFVSKVKSVKK